MFNQTSTNFSDQIVVAVAPFLAVHISRPQEEGFSSWRERTNTRGRYDPQNNGSLGETSPVSWALMYL